MRIHTSRMRILKLPPNRWSDFKALRLEALRNDPDAFGSTYEGTLERSDEWWVGRLVDGQTEPTKTLLFAEVDRQLVGMAGSYPEEEPGVVDIISMYVSPEHRRKGVARTLLKAVVAEVQGKTIRLCVTADQHGAVKLYESFGFVTIAETQLARSDGRPYIQLYMQFDDELSG